ncbi:MAG: cytidine deaminase [Enterobacteriaceae bacterium]|jgi:cytidine deaminase|nr:cytidine deaminase [Enterobacteriaceae bacterium]
MFSFDEMEKTACQIISPTLISPTFISSTFISSTQLNKYVQYGHVAAVILSQSGHIYTGISINTACSMGFCAEHGAIADMLKQRESRIMKVIAVNQHGNIIPPCGRCREFISQIHRDNIHAEVKVNKELILPLGELLPFDWKNV